MTTPSTYFGPCLDDWDPIYCCVIPTGAAAVTGSLLQAATEDLWKASGMQYGLCTTTMRPCRDECYSTSSGWPFTDWWQWGGGMWPRPLLYAGQWFNLTCGGCPGSCSCTALSKFRLPGPIHSITEIKIGGVVMPTGSYTVFDNYEVIRTDGGFWPACFPAGTQVLTSQGLRPIEAVKVGDLVLTHKNRWRRVKASMSTGVSETIQLTGRGGKLTCTPNHPLLVAEILTEKIGESVHRKLGGPGWERADTCLGAAWATPSSIEPLPIPLPEGWSWEDLPNNFWWIVGRWVGDGWTDSGNGNSRVVVCAGPHEMDDLRAELSKTGWKWRETGGFRFRFSNPALYRWIRENFGIGAINKRLPAWALGAPEHVRSGILEGYVSADGWNGKSANGKGNPYTSVHTISKELALGTRLLAATLGHSATIYTAKQPKAKGFSYRINWPQEKPNEPYAQAWADESHLWGRIRKIEFDEKLVQVFDIEVEEDHSFIADGFVVHNCQDMTLPDTEENTWSITFTQGQEVPELGKIALGQLLCEYARAFCAGGDCALPANIQSLIRQGVSITLNADQDWIERLGFVSRFIKYANPHGLDGPPGVFNIDLVEPVRWGT